METGREVAISYTISKDVAFASCLAGAPGGDYLSRAIVDCSGAPTADTAFMGTHLLPMDHDRQDVSTPATRCAAGIMPAAVSLSNAPPTVTPSSVMGLHEPCGISPRFRGNGL